MLMAGLVATSHARYSSQATASATGVEIAAGGAKESSDGGDVASAAAAAIKVLSVTSDVTAEAASSGGHSSSSHDHAHGRHNSSSSASATDAGASGDDADDGATTAPESADDGGEGAIGKNVSGLASEFVSILSVDCGTETMRLMCKASLDAKHAAKWSGVDLEVTREPDRRERTKERN